MSEEPRALVAPAAAPALAAAEARACLARLRDHWQAFWYELRAFHDGRGWLALGYPSFRACVEAELGVSEQRAYQLLDAARIRDELATTQPGLSLAGFTEGHARALKALPPPVRVEVASGLDFATTPRRELYRIAAQVKGELEGRRPPRAPVASPEAPPPHVAHGRGQLWVGDCLEVLPTLPPDSVHLVLTSPPFNSRWNYGPEDPTGDDLPTEAYLALLYGAVRACQRVLVPGGVLVLDLPASVRQGAIREWPGAAILEVHLASTAGWVYRGHKIWAKSKPSAAPDQPPILVPDEDGADLIIPSGTIYSTRTPFGAPSDWYFRHCHHVLLFASKETPRIPNAPARWPGEASVRGLRPYLELVKDVALWPPGRAGRKADAEPPEFPRVLVEEVLQLCAPGGGVVLDPFAGSGSVAKVGLPLGYDVWLIEKHPRYARRLAQLLRDAALGQPTADGAPS